MNSPGLIQLPSAVFHSRGNNAIEKTPQTSGTITTVPGF